jgi:2-polyprenyl-6-methoxyphenol hydroxylase-like FAD-dependent oxidoreductase
MTTNKANSEKKTALVIGGGIAGLLAARVLAEHYEAVLVIERDAAPEGPGPRTGSPQSFHLHQILPRGEVILERLFPGFGQDLVRLGAFYRESAVVEMINPYGTIPFPGDGKVVTYSRGLLEWVIRQRVQTINNIRFMYHQEVTGLLTSLDKTRVIGVNLRERGQLENQRQLTADLVIEASGRSSKLPQWLTALGLELPESERVTSSIGYSTRYYKIRSEKSHIAVMVVESDAPGGNCAGGVLKAIENDLWTVCLTSIGGEFPATDAKGFDEGLKKLISPALADILHGAEPVSEPRGYRLPECTRHHYEKMEQWPAGLLVMGDAFCNFDPIYGQGMTVAAIEAEALAAGLREQQGQPQPGFERQLLGQMQDAIYPAWWRSALEDLRWPGVTHCGSDAFKDAPFLHKYFDLCLKQSTRQLVQLMQQGQFNPLYLNYFMMNWLFISPRDVINATMLTALLESETPQEREAMLNDLFEGYDRNNIEAVLDSVAPNFSYSFGNLADFAPEEEAGFGQNSTYDEVGSSRL